MDVAQSLNQAREIGPQSRYGKDNMLITFALQGSTWYPKALAFCRNVYQANGILAKDQDFGDEFDSFAICWRYYSSQEPLAVMACLNKRPGMRLPIEKVFSLELEPNAVEIGRFAPHPECGRKDLRRCLQILCKMVLDVYIPANNNEKCFYMETTRKIVRLFEMCTPVKFEAMDVLPDLTKVPGQSLRFYQEKKPQAFRAIPNKEKFYLPCIAPEPVQTKDEFHVWTKDLSI